MPPEDVGGIHTWNELAHVLREGVRPTGLSGDLEMYADWLPEDVDPDAVDVDEINMMLSLVGLDPDQLLAAYEAATGMKFRLHPAIDALLGRTSPDVVVELATLHNAATPEPGDEPSHEELQALVLPWTVLLDAARGDGIPLTQAGWITPAVCERLWNEGGLNWGYGKGNREQHTPGISLVRRLALDSKLVRTFKGRLLLTRTGRAAAADVTALVDALGAGLIRAGSDAESDERVVTLTLIASGAFDPEDDEPTARGRMDWQREFLTGVADLLTRVGWSTDQGPITSQDLSAAPEILRALSVADQRPGLWFAPTPAARHLAWRALNPGDE